MHKHFFIVFCLLFLFFQPQLACAQNEVLGEEQKEAINLVTKGIRSYATIIDGDTVPMVHLRPYFVVSELIFKTKKQRSQYNNLVRKVKKAYPYAKLAGKKLKLYNQMLEGQPEEVRKALMKNVEKEIKAEFEDDLRDFTLSEGKILLKLIDRETGNTSYKLVQELRGTFSAVFWQSMARLFGANLKSDYNPEINEEDRRIEDIVLLLEKGEI